VHNHFLGWCSAMCPVRHPDACLLGYLFRIACNMVREASPANPGWELDIILPACFFADVVNSLLHNSGMFLEPVSTTIMLLMLCDTRRSSSERRLSNDVLGLPDVGLWLRERTSVS